MQYLRWAYTRQPDAERFGRLNCTGDRIAAFLGPGQGGPGLINAGCYLIPKDLLVGKKLPPAFSFEQDFLAQSPPLSLRVYVTDAQFLDIGIPDDYRRAQSVLAELM